MIGLDHAPTDDHDSGCHSTMLGVRAKKRGPVLLRHQSGQGRVERRRKYGNSHSEIGLLRDVVGHVDLDGLEISQLPRMEGLVC